MYGGLRLRNGGRRNRGAVNALRRLKRALSAKSSRKTVRKSRWSRERRDPEAKLAAESNPA